MPGWSRPLQPHYKRDMAHKATQHPTIDDATHAAIAAWIDARGIDWKHDLRTIWNTDSPTIRGVAPESLQRLRNSHGLAWLDTYEHAARTTGDVPTVRDTFDADTIVESVARMMFGLAWAEHEEEQWCSPGGCDILDVMPEGTPEPFTSWATDAVNATLDAADNSPAVVVNWTEASWADDEDLARAIYLTLGGYDDGFGAVGIECPDGLPSMDCDARLHYDGPDDIADAVEASTVICRACNVTPANDDGGLLCDACTPDPEAERYADARRAEESAARAAVERLNETDRGANR